MDKTSTNKYIIFNSIGNQEKDLIGTAVVYSIKEAYPKHKIIVVTNFPEIWLHNPEVYRVYKAGSTPYFYDDYIDHKDSLIFWQNPYSLDDIIQKRKHIIEAWCELCGVPYKKTKPRVYLTQRELEVTQRILGLNKNQKPVFLIQTHSEAFPNMPYVWDKDIPHKNSQNIVNEMIKKGYRVLHLATGKEPVLLGSEKINLDLRQTLCAIDFSDTRLLINSFSQHAASALGKKSVIFWVGQSPTLNGYPLHLNVVPSITNDLGRFVSTWNEFYQSNGEGLTKPPFPIENYYSDEEILELLTTI